MQTEVKNTEPVFKRKKRIGINPLNIPDQGSLCVEIISTEVGMFERRNDDPIPFVEVVNMKTGESGHLWLSGQLNYQFTEMHKIKGSLQGVKVEIIHKGKKPWTTPEGEKAVVNEYDLFELE
jgi:hypothetical protein